MDAAGLGTTLENRGFRCRSECLEHKETNPFNSRLAAGRKLGKRQVEWAEIAHGLLFCLQGKEDLFQPNGYYQDIFWMKILRLGGILRV